MVTEDCQVVLGSGGDDDVDLLLGLDLVQIRIPVVTYKLHSQCLFYNRMVNCFGIVGPKVLLY